MCTVEEACKCILHEHKDGFNYILYTVLNFWCDPRSERGVVLLDECVNESMFFFLNKTFCSQKSCKKLSLVALARDLCSRKLCLPCELGAINLSHFSTQN